MNGNRQASVNHRSAAKPALLLALVCLFFFNFFSGAGAQSNARALLSPPDTSKFPIVSAYLDVHDANGQFLHNLQSSEITILEDDHPAALLGLHEGQPGVRVLVAINAGPALGIRDQQGAVRYEAILKALQAWGQELGSGSGGQPEGQSDYSLFTNQGTLANAVTDPAEWLKALNNYHPDMRSAQPSLESLTRAMALAGEPTPRYGMERAILYITPNPEGASLSGLADLADLARQTSVHIFIWMIASSSSFSSSGANALGMLAAQTGGQLFTFSGTETLPDIQAYLEPLRYQYELSYTSAVNKTGSNSLLIKIKRDDLELSTPLQIFSLNILPPNPMFVSPPVEITRSSPPDSLNPLDELSPSEQSLEILVEFPDGHKRPLKYVRLYVDNQMVQENTQEPFDRLRWNLNAYTTPGRHLLRVEVQDSLGLTRTSHDTPIQIGIRLPARAPLQDPAHPSTLPAILAIILAGSALVIVLILGWRRRANDPLTQPVRGHSAVPGFTRRPAPPRRSPPAASSEIPTVPSKAGRSAPPAVRSLPASWLSWPRQPATVPSSLARLIRLSENNQPLPGNPIPILTREVTIGRDPVQATCVLESLCVEGLHARLLQEDGGGYIIKDEGSVAGTWVNYAPISREGVRLEHGDLIHIGKVAFRFELSKPAHIRKPQVKAYKETL